MPQYDFHARSATGESITGVISAPTPTDAARKIRAGGKVPVEINETVVRPAATDTAPITLGSNRVRAVDVTLFASQMAVMIDTGVSLTEALRSIIEQDISPGLQRALVRVLADVESGTSFSSALQRHPQVFKPLFVNLVRASEASGQLGVMLDRVAEYFHAQRETQRKVISAMIYPCFLMTMSIGVVIFMLTYLMPRFTGIYAGREALLPTPTKILINVSGAMAATWPVWSSGLILVGGAMWIALRTQSGRRVGARLLLRLPLVGRMYHRTYLLRSLRTLGTLVDSGVALLDAVGITRAVVGNATFQTLWDRVGRRVEVGEQLSAPLRESSLIPASVTQMITAGERSGKLGIVLDRISRFLERELDQAIKRVTLLIEPIMILVMGAIVGSIVIALLLPIFTISRTMG